MHLFNSKLKRDSPAQPLISDSEELGVVDMTTTGGCLEGKNLWSVTPSLLYVKSNPQMVGD